MLHTLPLEILCQVFQQTPNITLGHLLLTSKSTSAAAKTIADFRGRGVEALLCDVFSALETKHEEEIQRMLARKKKQGLTDGPRETWWSDRVRAGGMVVLLRTAKFAKLYTGDIRICLRHVSPGIIRLYAALWVDVAYIVHEHRAWADREEETTFDVCKRTVHFIANPSKPDRRDHGEFPVNGGLKEYICKIAYRGVELVKDGTTVIGLD